jgi:hypothetical protein
MGAAIRQQFPVVEAIMSGDSITVEAVFEDGWPADVAAISRVLAEEDRRLAEAMLPAVRDTWPPGEGSP